MKNQPWWLPFKRWFYRVILGKELLIFHKKITGIVIGGGEKENAPD